MVKVGALTVSGMVAVAVAVVPVAAPVMISVFVPITAVLLEVSVSWELPIARSGEKEAVTPAGKFETLNFTLPGIGVCGLIWMFAVVEVD
jgi:hypothetical protein